MGAADGSGNKQRSGNEAESGTDGEIANCDTEQLHRRKLVANGFRPRRWSNELRPKLGSPRSERKRKRGKFGTYTSRCSILRYKPVAEVGSKRFSTTQMAERTAAKIRLNQGRKGSGNEVNSVPIRVDEAYCDTEQLHRRLGTMVVNDFQPRRWPAEIRFNHGRKTSKEAGTR
jgi:hypothetical protein